MRLVRLVAVLVALLMAPSLARAADCSVLLDVSGSMDGFRVSEEYRRVLRGLDAECDRKFLFGVDLRETTEPLESARYSDAKSRLGHALAAWERSTANRPGARLVMITDNVVDEAGGAGGQQDFYQRLQDEASPYERIGVLLLRPGFSGRVYAPPPSSDKDDYAGYRALSIYTFARKGAPADWLGRVEDVVSEAGIKPADVPKPSARGVFSSLSLSPFAPRGYASAGPPSGSAIGIGKVRGQVRMGKDDTILIDAGASDEDFAFELPISITESPDWRFGVGGQVPFEARLRFRPDALAPAGEVVPCQVDRGAKGLLKITCRLKSHWAGLSAEQRTALSREEASLRRGELEIRAKVSRDDITLTGPLAAAWNWNGASAALGTADPRVQERVYRLDDLMRGMIREQDLQATIGRRFQVEVTLSHSGFPAIAAFIRDNAKALLLAAGFGLFLAAVVALAVMRPTYLIKGVRGGEQTRQLGFLQATEVQSADGHHRVTIWPLGVCLLFIAPTGRVRPPMLPFGGGRISIAKGGPSPGRAASIDLRINKTGRKGPPSPARPGSRTRPLRPGARGAPN